MLVLKCKTCKQEKPKTEEYFYKNGDYHGGFRHECKECLRSKNQKIYANNKNQFSLKNLRYRFKLAYGDYPTERELKIYKEYFKNTKEITI